MQSSMEDDMHRQLQAPACQSHSSSSSSSSDSFLGVSLQLFDASTGTTAAAAACLLLFFFLALAVIYCIVIITICDNNSSRLIRRFIKWFKGRRRRKKNADADASAPAPPPPPGRDSSRWWWSVVETLSFLAANSSGRGFYHFVDSRHRRYGRPPCFRTALFGATHVFVSSPSAARSLLAADHAAAGGFSKRYVRTVADLLGEHSLLCASSHATHRALRRAVAPLFGNAHATASMAATFDALTRRIIKRDWAAAAATTTAVVVLDAALDVTFEAICDMLIGGGGGRTTSTTLMRTDVKRQLQSDVVTVTRALLAFPLRLPGTRFHAGLRARKRIMDVLRREIASRQRQIDEIMDMEEEEDDDDYHRRHGEHDDDGDFLQSLLLLRMRRRRREEEQLLQLQQQSPSSSSARHHNDDDDHLFLTDDQILDNILTLIIAGQVTTASAITWMVKYLADNKDFQETLRSVQLELALKHQHADDAPLTLQHLNSMDLAYMTVKESLRMASIVSWFPRVALEDCQVAGFHISKGWIVNIDARALHYDATLYDNPTMFDPSRFRGEDTYTNKQQSPYSFLVFGAGGRTCLGMNLAKIMMLIFLHHLVTTWRWEMADEDPSLEKWAMFPRLKSGCPIHLTPI